MGRGRWYPLFAVFLSMLTVGIVSIVYTNHVSHKLCSIIQILDEAYNATPPQTPTGKSLAGEIAKYNDDQCS